MQIYRISQSAKRGYDTFDSAIVVANSEYQARKMRPLHFDDFEWIDEPSIYTNRSWADSADDVNVELIGRYIGDKTEPYLILSSFNAG